ncbi:DciA family protein [Aliidiomarina indica]|uniref:DciA family protein n=1 Tax=Aliidiomarina indica TaxID=2749147 RepID=UPI00188EF127|nr:DciA family protein [Aliidiomarina indica]
MLRKPPKTVQSLLNDGPLARLQKKQSVQEQLYALWSETVPADLLANSRCLSVQGQTLIIAARSGVWATRIRLMQTHIMAKFTELPDTNIRSLEVKIRPQL